MQHSAENNNGRRLATIKQIPDLPGYGVFTESSLRHMIFQSSDRFNSAGDIIPGNGLGEAIIRIGRKVLVDLDAFDRWLDANKQSGANE